MLSATPFSYVTEDKNMNKALTTMVGAALLCGAAVPAFAQETKSTDISLRAGLFAPSDRFVRNNAGDSMFTAGVDYNWKTLTNGSVFFSLDYAAKGDFRVVPLLVNYKVQKNEFYFFGGVGVSFSRVPSGSGSSDKSEFGYQVGVGYDFQKGTNPLFVEAKYMGNGKDELNGVGVYLGIRL